MLCQQLIQSLGNLKINNWMNYNNSWSLSLYDNNKPNPNNLIFWHLPKEKNNGIRKNRDIFIGFKAWQKKNQIYSKQLSNRSTRSSCKKISSCKSKIKSRGSRNSMIRSWLIRRVMKTESKWWISFSRFFRRWNWNMMKIFRIIKS